MIDIPALAEKIAAMLDYDEAEDLLTLLQSEDDNEWRRLADALDDALEALTQ